MLYRTLLPKQSYRIYMSIDPCYEILQISTEIVISYLHVNSPEKDMAYYKIALKQSIYMYIIALKVMSYYTIAQNCHIIFTLNTPEIIMSY